MDSSPHPENIEGKLVETHRFNHEMHHSVRWDYLAGIVVVTIVLALFLKRRSTGEEPEEKDDVADLAEEGIEKGSIW